MTGALTKTLVLLNPCVGVPCSHNGVLVEPTDVAAIRDSLISIITSAKSWEQYSESGR